MYVEYVLSYHCTLLLAMNMSWNQGSVPGTVRLIHSINSEHKQQTVEVQTLNTSPSKLFTYLNASNHDAVMNVSIPTGTEKYYSIYNCNAPKSKT